MKNLEIIDGTICEKCGEEVASGNKLCDTCKSVHYDFDKSRSFAKYGEIASKIVKRFKYSGKKYYAKHIAEMMATKTENFDNVDFITFVPIGEKRKRERGFNQAEEIAKELSALANIPVINLFHKIGSEKHQAGLSQKERRKNLKGTIVFGADDQENIKGKTILIIDDVFTTGATLSECAGVLRKSKYKPNKVFAYTFAKTMLFSTNNG